MKYVPTVEDAKQNILCYELHRNSMGWQLSLQGENIATFISTQEADELLACFALEDQRLENDLLEIERDS